MRGKKDEPFFPGRLGNGEDEEEEVGMLGPPCFRSLGISLEDFMYPISPGGGGKGMPVLTVVRWLARARPS